MPDPRVARHADSGADAEVKGRAGERLYHTIIETANEGVWVIDEYSRTTFVNAKLAQMLGYEPEEMLERPLFDFMDDEARRIAEDNVARHAQGLDEAQDFRFRRKDGSELWAILGTNPLVDETGKYLGAVAMVSDVTDRRRAEHEIRDSEARMAEAQRVAHFGSWTWEVAANRVTWSDQLYRIYGLRPGRFEATFEGYLERVHPDDRDRVGQLIGAALKDKRPFSFEERIVQPGGDVRLLRSQGRVICDEDAQAIRMVGVCHDITELRAAEAASRKAELRFQKAFDDAPIGVALVGVVEPDTGRFLEVNRAFCQMTGYSATQLVDMRIPTLTHPHDVPDALEYFEALLTGEVDRYTMEKRVLHAEGTAIWVLVSASLVRDEDNKPQYAIVQAVDITERKRFEGQLEYLAEHDPLTGLSNRRRFEQDLDQQVAYTARYGGHGAVLVIDLDRFKYVNDTLGHAVGDDLLRRVGALLKDRLRDTDVVARLGGDEFAVLLPVAEEAEARHLAEELLSDIGKRAPALASGGITRVTASIGISFFGQETKSRGEDVMISADLAMYQAKELGRARVEVLETVDEPRSRMRARMTWTQRIRDAVEDDRLVLFQQPIIDLRSGDVSRYELLVRMEAEAGEMVPPAAFLSIAEDSGSVLQIDQWVVGRATELIAEANRAGRKLTLEVNLSGASLSEPSLLEGIEQALDASGIEASSLVFEVTETTAIVNIANAKRLATRLGELGCSFALDDFGAGFGSFYYLKHLPFDYLKIDGDFIRQLPESRPDQLTVKAIVQIAHGLKKKTIAEFVESEKTLGLLRRYGVDFAQGFYLGRPASVADGWPERTPDGLADSSVEA